MRTPAIARKPDLPVSVIGAILTICGVFDVADRLGVSADELAELLGAVIMIGAYLRHRLERGRDVAGPS